MRHNRRAFVDRVDFVTSVGHGSGAGDRERLGLTGAGPVRVITDLGVLEPHPVTRELVLTGVHPGVDVDTVREATGWDLEVAEDLALTPRPTGDELAVLRSLTAAA
jgi:glutaconate CoA-transferase subunit B